MTSRTSTVHLPLTGPGGEPVDFWRTLQSHGVAELPPAFVDPELRSLTVTLQLDSGSPKTVTVSQEQSGFATISSLVRLTANEKRAAARQVGHLLRLDQDLSGFYMEIAQDPDLAWAVAGAGRMTRCATVFEEVIKTILTTNCAWSGTVRMVNALVQQLGEPADSAPPDSPSGRAFPTPAAMASMDDAFYREIVRAGYRGPYLRQIATEVAAGQLDLEAFAAPPAELTDDELVVRLLALPGVGPYAASHIMMMLGRYSRLILDSWTRPTYAQLTGRENVPDAEIEARFARYGDYAGLAFWLLLTRDWVDDG